MGRPATSYSKGTADGICLRIAGGESLTEICKGDDSPSRGTVSHWLKGERGAPESFVNDYARARELQAEFYCDQVIAIADDCVDDSESVQKARLRVDSRKWTLGVMDRGKYSERVSVDHGNQPDNPLTAAPEAQAILDSMSDETRALLDKALAKDMMGEGK